MKEPETVKTALFAAVSLLSMCLVFVFVRGANVRGEYETFLAQELLCQAGPIRDTEEDVSDAFFKLKDRSDDPGVTYQLYPLCYWVVGSLELLPDSGITRILLISS